MKLEVISLIYKSPDYLDFIKDQILRFCRDFDDVQVDFRIVANDANEKVLTALQNDDFPYTIYNDPKPDDYYLNKVYRCWNFCATSSNADLICFVNSDMAFSENWLKPLYALHNLGYLPTSRLVESGKMPSATHGYSKNFGRHPNEFNESDWVKFVEVIKEDKTLPGGLYMPVIFDRSEFILSGMYPEGNIYNGEVGSRSYHATPGDYVLFQRFQQLTDREHVTAFNSVCYHIQEGELDAK